MAYLKQNGKFRIFVVDDEEIISSTIAAILRLNGYEAAAFTVPLEALAASHAHVPDLLVADIVMPVLSGVDLAMQLQAFHPGCRVLLFSGEWTAADFPDLAHGGKCGFEMIPKPVHPNELLKKVQEMLSSIPSVPSDGEDQAQTRLAKNMKETIAAVRADIAASTARKQPARRRTPRDRER